MCPDGFELSSDNKTCIDIDECIQKSETICDGYKCINTEGSYLCDCHDGKKQSCSNICKSGYTLDSDGKNCIDINDCLNENGNCEHICVNTDGGYYCLCNNGYKLNIDGKTCDGNKIFYNFKSSLICFFFINFI